MIDAPRDAAPLALDPQKPVDVVALGAAIVDILAFVDDNFLADHGVAKAGMTLIDTEKAESIHRAMTNPREISGGSAANTAAGLAALGGKVAFVGKTREDALGRLFREDIERIGVAFHTEPFDIDADAFGGTGRSMIMVTPDAQRSMATDLGVSGHLSRADILEEHVAAAKIVYLEGYLWDRDATKDAMRAANAIAKGHGGRVALTLSDTFCVERHRDSFLDLIEHDVDLLFANESEILALYQATDVAAALERAAQSVGVAVVTRSEKGAVAAAGVERAAVPAAAIDKLVDTTGAGDLFASGFLHGLLAGRDLETCARYGCAAASEVIQHLGARPERDLKEVLGL